MRTKPQKLMQAKRLRSAMTDAEQHLWYRLRANRSLAKFKRQVPLGPYVADFACLNARLIIELDGSQHADSTRDVVRDAWLNAQGYRVLRFWNHDALLHTDEVLNAIWNALAESAQALSPAFGRAGDCHWAVPSKPNASPTCGGRGETNVALVPAHLSPAVGGREAGREGLAQREKPQ